MSLPVLIPTLLDFERSPGRFPLAKREPALLFDCAHTVLLLAAGRPVDGLEDWETSGQEQARRAARFFVRTALLRPGTDAYTVLGLSRLADADSIRSHYRLMIRLTHPDFSGGDSEWPADAATRINLANDVLSSARKRADLDRTLAEAVSATGVHGSRPASHVHAAVAQRASRSPAPRSTSATGQPPARGAQGVGIPVGLKMLVFGGGAVATVVGLLVLNPPGDDRSLVARESATSGEQSATQVPSATPAVQLASTDDLPPGSEVPRDPLKLTRELGLLPSRQDPAPVKALPQPAPAKEVLRPAPAAERPIKTVVVAPRIRVTELPAPPPDATDAAPAAAPAQASAPNLPSPSPALRPPLPVVAVDTAPAPATLAISAAPAVTPKAPRLPEVQPLLARIEQVAQRGLGVPLAMLIHPGSRKTPGTQKFVFDFQDALAGYRVTGLARTDVDSREVGDQLDVDLRMHFNLEDVQGSSLSRQVSVRARFGKVEDHVALVRMTLIPPGGGR